jgi:hypothetical protein
MPSRLYFLSAVFLILRACMHPVYYDGPYHGKVVLADTGAPIAGAVILGTWRRLVAIGPGGGYSEPYAAQEVVTDQQGEFVIPGLGLRFFSLLEPMNVVIFKAGHEYFGDYRWRSFKEDRILRQRVTWEGKKAVIPLQRLTMEERKKRYTGPASTFPHQKQKLLIRELNKERIELGRSPSYEESE